MKRIPLTQGKFAVVDDQDYKFLTQWNWYLLARNDRRNCYAVRNKSPRGTGLIYMHRVIAKRARRLGRKVDHRDRDGLNNRRKNLRPASSQQNQANAPYNRNNKSGYKGVSWSKYHRLWKATIRVNYRQFFLGYHSNKKTAACAYNKAARKHFGKFAGFNKV